MRITEAGLRRIIREEIEQLDEISWPAFAKAKKIDPQISTMKDLRALIKNVNKEKKIEKGVEGLADAGLGFVADLVPGGGTLLSLAQTVRDLYKEPDEKKSGTKLDLLNVDDEISKIVDDTVEDNFLNKATDYLDDLGDDERIPDMTQVLSKYLSNTYDSRTVTGFSESRRRGGHSLSLSRHLYGNKHHAGRVSTRGLPLSQGGISEGTQGLNESFRDHYGQHHGKWVEMSHEEVDEHPEIYDEMSGMIDRSYAYLGGHSNYPNAGSIAADNDITLFKLIDVDTDPEADAVMFKKRTPFGLKNIASGNDGSPIAKTAFKDDYLSALRQPGNYTEVSGLAANLVLKNGINSVKDESQVRKVLGGKNITWHGEHPRGEFPGSYGWYTRLINGVPHAKIMVGLPIVEGIDEPKYRGKGRLSTRRNRR